MCACVSCVLCVMSNVCLCASCVSVCVTRVGVCHMCLVCRGCRVSVCVYVYWCTFNMQPLRKLSCHNKMLIKPLLQKLSGDENCNHDVDDKDVKDRDGEVSSGGFN